MSLRAVGQGMSRARRLGWTLAGLALLAAFLLAVGPRRLAANLAAADPRFAALGAGAALVALACWSESQRRVYRAAGAHPGAGRFLLAYAAAVFAKGVLPGGRAGGPVVVAYVVGRETDLAFEQDLAAAAAGRLLGFAGAVGPALAGLAVLSADGGLARALVPAVVAVAAATAALALAVRARPDAARSVVLALARAARVTLGRVSGRVQAGAAPERVSERLDRASATLRSVARDRRALLGALLFAVAGWLAYASVLAAALLALARPAHLALAMFAVPAASLATAVPLPSGVGGVEVALTGALTALTGLALPDVAAAVVLYRLAGDAFLVVVGAAAAAVRARAS